MDVTLSDGYKIFVEPVGDGFPVIVLHGGPGMDHTMFRPYLDALGDEFRLLYVDERGQGRSGRVDPETLNLEVFAQDVDRLAEALDLDAFALLGHSFGAIITGWHATEIGTATAYVISGGGDTSENLERDVDESISRRDDADVIRRSWDLEQTAETPQDLARLMDMQLPFHFHREPPKDAFRNTVYSPQVLKHFANIGYGQFDYTAKLKDVTKPTLVIVGEHDPTTTPRAARVLAEGIPNARLEIVRDAGHMSFVEENDAYLGAVRRFLSGIAFKP
jgi:proline iminopeptidase